MAMTEPILKVFAKTCVAVLWERYVKSYRKGDGVTSSKAGSLKANAIRSATNVAGETPV